MKLIRSLSTLVLLGSVSWMLGCTADENTSGPSASAGGSGVAGGAVVPHSHEGFDAHAHEGEDAHVHESDASKTEVPMTEAPADDAPTSEEPKTEAPADDAPKSE
ncbi:MAG: hypothetical protein WKF77_30455 [Planctomycetaceae bacterium]